MLTIVEREREARLLAITEEEPEEGKKMTSRDISLVVSQIVNLFMNQMEACPKASSRLKIMEHFLEDNRLSQFLPKYYPRWQDAKVQFEFLKNYKQELRL